MGYYQRKFNDFIRTFVFDMRTYNGIARPDYTPERISELKPDEVFVFGVNRNDECTENGKLSAQKTVTTVHKNQ